MHSNQKLFSFITCQKIENCWKNKYYRKITESFFSAQVPVKSQNIQMKMWQVEKEMKSSSWGNEAHFSKSWNYLSKNTDLIKLKNGIITSMLENRKQMLLIFENFVTSVFILNFPNCFVEKFENNGNLNSLNSSCYH